ncbi:MAG: hypothetical protein LBR28_01700 [Bacteroidales bacterium]|jgi:hypothetical protein|nr:hypothetical protein [Bacteroidales bacterium]
MKRYIFGIFASIIMLFVACDNFDGEQEIPAYIRIRGFNLIQNPSWTEQNQSVGFLSNEIIDACVTVGSDTMQRFPLKTDGCLIPVLHTGDTKIIVQAGVKLNGIKTTRDYYPFYSALIKNVNLVEDSIIDLGVIDIMYNPAMTKIRLNEEFEDSYVAFKEVRIDTILNVMQKTERNDSVKYGNYCGAMYMNTNTESYKMICKDSIYYTNTAGAILEIDYHANIPFEIGIYGNYDGTGTYKYISAMGLNPNASNNVENYNNEWKKIYVVLGKVWSQLGYPSYFRFYFEPSNPNKISNGWVHIDNVKLVTYHD